MKTIQEFLVFTNLKNNVLKESIILVLASLLYCMIYSFTSLLAYQSGTTMYYILLYVVVIWAAFIYMIILFAFLQKKRDYDTKLRMKKYLIPCLSVQTIFFILMVGSGVLSYALMVNDQLSINAFVLTPFMMISLMMYIPLQIFAFFEIYEGVRNPFVMIKNAFLKIMKHYRAVFYSLLVLLLITMLYQGILSMVFNLHNSFVIASATTDMLVRSNPFMDVFDYIAYIGKDNQLLLQVGVSFVYGVIMSVALVFYYMFMICVYDNDIKV
ncbi:MAG: hypothetical protein RSC10_01675 [Longicatena sp.]